MRIDICTLFPAMCEAVLGESIVGRARAAGKLDVRCRHLRDYAVRKGGYIDDTLCGGGKGMLLQPEPFYRCWRQVCDEAGGVPHTVCLSPRGKVLTQDIAARLAGYGHLLLLCGHYEGIDERLIEEIVDEEISVGDFVLTGGELPALLLADCVARLCDGVLADESCWQNESHGVANGGLLEGPQYTRPVEWRGRTVPDVLLSGHHANITKWKREQALLTTRRHRPDLFKKAALTPADRLFLARAGEEDEEARACDETP